MTSHCIATGGNKQEGIPELLKGSDDGVVQQLGIKIFSDKLS